MKPRSAPPLLHAVSSRSRGGPASSTRKPVSVQRSAVASMGWQHAARTPPSAAGAKLGLSRPKPEGHSRACATRTPPRSEQAAAIVASSACGEQVPSAAFPQRPAPLARQSTLELLMHHCVRDQPPTHGQPFRCASEGGFSGDAQAVDADPSGMPASAAVRSESSHALTIHNVAATSRAALFAVIRSPLRSTGRLSGHDPGREKVGVDARSVRSGDPLRHAWQVIAPAREHARPLRE